jgi:hypothetical protein
VVPCTSTASARAAKGRRQGRRHTVVREDATVGMATVRPSLAGFIGAARPGRRSSLRSAR